MRTAEETWETITWILCNCFHHSLFCGNSIIWNMRYFYAWLHISRHYAAVIESPGTIRLYLARAISPVVKNSWITMIPIEFTLYCFGDIFLLIRVQRHKTTKALSNALVYDCEWFRPPESCSTYADICVQCLPNIADVTGRGSNPQPRAREANAHTSSPIELIN